MMRGGGLVETSLLTSLSPPLLLGVRAEGLTGIWGLSFLSHMNGDLVVFTPKMGT